jgi:hypothetical protein
MDNANSDQPKLIWLNNKTTYTAIISKEAVKDYGFIEVDNVVLEGGPSGLVLKKTE